MADDIERLTEELRAARAQIARLEEIAHEDEVTGVLNRRGFRRDLTRALAHKDRYGGALALVMADLDGLKRVNDSFGHQAGDDVLRLVALGLRAAVRTSDTVARLGGDEFGVILWNIGEEAARAKVEQLRRVPSTLASLGEDVRPLIGLSAGVAVLVDGDDGDALMARADADLYFDKQRRGRLAR
jgi:diguanylate cyclase (GGDEF)-like protein